MSGDESVTAPHMRMEVCATVRTSTQLEDTLGEMDMLIRKENLRAVLAALGKRWPLGGVDREGDERTGDTRFWAKPSVRSAGLFFRIPNRILNESKMTRDHLRGYLNRARFLD